MTGERAPQQESRERLEKEFRRVHKALQADHMGLWEEAFEFSAIAKEEQDLLAAGVSPQEIQKLSVLEDRRFEIERGLWEEYDDLGVQLDQETRSRIKKDILFYLSTVYTRKHGLHRGDFPGGERLGRSKESAMRYPTAPEILKNIPSESDWELIVRLDDLSSGAMDPGKRPSERVIDEAYIAEARRRAHLLLEAADEAKKVVMGTKAAT